MSVQNAVIESVMDMIDGLGLFSTCRRGALGTDPGITCELSVTGTGSVFMDKRSYIILDLTINAKHPDMQVLSDDMQTLFVTLSRRFEYPSGNGWQMVDITTYAQPRIIGREDNGDWLMAGSLHVKYYHM